MSTNGGAPPPTTKALLAVIPMLQLTASEIITTAAALLTIAHANGQNVPVDTAGRLEESIGRLTKLRGDLEDVADALRS